VVQIVSNWDSVGVISHCALSAEKSISCAFQFWRSQSA
jgi:hypothetical protein